MKDFNLPASFEKNETENVEILAKNAVNMGLIPKIIFAVCAAGISFGGLLYFFSPWL